MSNPQNPIAVERFVESCETVAHLLVQNVGEAEEEQGHYHIASQDQQDRY